MFGPDITHRFLDSNGLNLLVICTPHLPAHITEAIAFCGHGNRSGHTK